MRVISLFSDCRIFCKADNGPVCGTDGKQYGNECQLGESACKSGRSDLAVAHYGPCQRPNVYRTRHPSRPVPVRKRSIEQELANVESAGHPSKRLSFRKKRLIEQGQLNLNLSRF